MRCPAVRNKDAPDVSNYKLALYFRVSLRVWTVQVSNVLVNNRPRQSCLRSPTMRIALPLPHELSLLWPSYIPSPPWMVNGTWCVECIRAWIIHKIQYSLSARYRRGSVVAFCVRADMYHYSCVSRVWFPSNKWKCVRRLCFLDIWFCERHQDHQYCWVNTL